MTEAPGMGEQLRDRYPKFDDALKFVKKHRMPTCKCAIGAMPRDNGQSVSYGYSNGAEHVAAAICAVIEENAQGENEWDVAELNVLREDGKIFARIEESDLIWFSPLTDAEADEVRAEWRKTQKKSVRGERPNNCDPFESGQDLYPYMPGGEWVALDDVE